MPKNSASCMRWAAVLAMATVAFGAAKQNAKKAPAGKPGEAGELYVKKDTWAQTMVASRAALIERSAKMTGEKAGTFQPYTSPQIQGTAETPHRVVVDVTGVNVLRLAASLDSGGGNCHIWGDAKVIAADGTVKHLGSMKPLSVKVGWGQLLVDKNWQGNPLRIGKQKFEQGIWVHSNSDVAYLLEGKYARFEAFVGMDADRATGVATFWVQSGGADHSDAVWSAISRDFPRQSAWFAKDFGKNHTDWFRSASNANQENGIIRRALGQSGTAGQSLLKELEKLAKAKTSANDAAWLELYGLACRQRDLQTALAGIGLAEVQAAMQKEREALAGVNADDKKWDALQARANGYAAMVAPLGEMRVAGLKESIELLSKAMGQKYAGEKLQSRLAEIEQKWQQMAPAILKNDPNAAKQVAELAGGLKDFRRQMILAVAGMGQALDSSTDLVTEWESQFQALKHDLSNRGHFEKVADEVYRPESALMAEDRDPLDIVVRRTGALINHLNKIAPALDLSKAKAELAAVQNSRQQVAVESAQARFVLFAEACRIRRAVTFANPLVQMDQMLFITRVRPVYQHMCDQYYGMAQHPGGGLYILKNPLSAKPEVKDVLANSVVENGRLKGQKLSGGPLKKWNITFDGSGNQHGEETEGGSFLSPDLSYDGKQIAFSYVECRDDRNHLHHTDASRGHWVEGRCYHIFKVNVDGSGLKMLTDGTWNEFDPVWLPNGRIAMISERRGGYLRCGRVCPTYTLYDMAADGTDITMLSPHETNEWHPSVTNDGRIVYTRWDYVDRHGCTAHLPWITTLDGRDSRALHGNFAPRNSRPDMELDIKAIPNSNKFSATAAPHHGQAFGSIVIIDPNVPDDDGMGPVRRVTPEVGFPESQGGTETYGTPLPLSEDFYLAVYDVEMNGPARKPFGSSNYGIYIVDAFGNRELVYRDARVSCQSPIPLKASVAPPVGPTAQIEKSDRGPGTGSPSNPNAKATLTVINAYDSLKPWPEGTKITALRVLQVLPMTVPSGGLRPHETGLRLPEAGDSVVPVRYVLGTVPVEKDGSAYFTVPANREMFFQALDERGLAVQSMRSATYLKEGEHLTCVGCHETKHTAPAPPTNVPLALKRAPSPIRPDVEGANPFSYPKLVQPVLDRQCVSCHDQERSKGNAKAISLAKDPIQGHFYTSYVNLATKYAFRTYGSGYRTTPGQFGARASKLFEILEKGHYNVKLNEEDMHRLTLWLDCSSMFYGVYEKEGGQAQLRGEDAKPTLE